MHHLQFLVKFFLISYHALSTHLFLSIRKIITKSCYLLLFNQKTQHTKKTTAKPGVDSGIHHPPSRPVSSGKNSSSGGESFGHGNCGPWPEGQRVGFTVTWLSSRIRPYGEGHAMVYRGFPKGHGGDGYMLNIHIYIYLVNVQLWRCLVVDHPSASHLTKGGFFTSQLGLRVSLWRERIVVVGFEPYFYLARGQRSFVVSGGTSYLRRILDSDRILGKRAHWLRQTLSGGFYVGYLQFSLIVVFWYQSHW